MAITEGEWIECGIDRICSEGRHNAVALRPEDGVRDWPDNVRLIIQSKRMLTFIEGIRDAYVVAGAGSCYCGAGGNKRCAVCVLDEAKAIIEAVKPPPQPCVTCGKLP